jgi:hypothetical protein
MPTRRNFEEKQPYEIFDFDVNFGTAIPLGANELISAEAFAIRWLRKKPSVTEDATLEILQSPVPVLVPGPCGEPPLKARVIIKDGTDGYDYQITVRGVFDTGRRLEEEIFIRVKER